MTNQSSSDRTVGRGTHLFVAMGATLIVTTVAWAANGKLDVVSPATGEVVPSTQVKEVQHLEGGIVREFLVREGESVEAGQAILVLEPVRPDADVQEVATRVAALEADIARMNAERSASAEPDYGSLQETHPSIVSKSLDLFQSRRADLENRLAFQVQVVDQRAAEIRETDARLAASTTRSGLMAEQVEISTALLADEMTHRMKHLELLKELETVQGLVAQDRAKRERLQAQLGQAEIELEGIEREYQRDLREELEDANRALAEYKSRLTKFEDSLARTIVRAPSAGTIKTLYFTTEGGVVRPGEMVADIVPEGDRLVIEARLPVPEIGHVVPGQSVSIRLQSAEAVRYGVIQGTVARVSPDAIKPEDAEPYYAVNVETSAGAFESAAGRYQLVPGVQVICSIITGERTVLEYLLSPVLAAGDTALRER